MIDDGGSRPVPDPTVLTTEQLLREVASLKELTLTLLTSAEAVNSERFRSVGQQLALVEQQRVEQKSDTKAAVDAALTAQKEAVKERTTASERAIAKSEAATTKQLDQQAITFATAIKGLTDLLDELKERVGKLESVKVAVAERATEQRLSTGQMIAVAGLVLVACSVLIAAVVAFRPHGG